MRTSLRKVNETFLFFFENCNCFLPLIIMKRGMDIEEGKK